MAAKKNVMQEYLRKLPQGEVFGTEDADDYCDAPDIVAMMAEAEAQLEAEKAENLAQGGLGGAKHPKGRSFAPIKEARVRYLQKLMASMRYVTFHTSDALARKWQLSPSTVEKDAAEAGRLFAVDPERREAMRGELTAKLASIAHMAVTMRNNITGLPDMQAALKALELQGKYMRVDADIAEASSARGDVNIQVVYGKQDVEDK